MTNKITIGVFASIFVLFLLIGIQPEFQKV